MRLCLDARVLQPHFPGIGRYTRNLLRALVAVDPTLELELLTEPGAERLSLPNARWHEVETVFSPRAQLLLPWRIRRLGAELFHAPYYLYPFAAPGPIVVTLHDLIPLDYPDPSARRRARWLYEPLHRIAERRAAAILTDSDAARASILRHLDVGPSRIAVVPLAPDPRFRADPSVARERFLFTLFSTKPHKNSERLLRAYAATRPAGHGVPLLVAGLGPATWRPFAARAEAEGVGDWVRPLDRLSDDDLRDHYQRCLAFLFPSYAEGFGLPVLEALACGAPTLIANRPPMIDLAAGAALTVDPFDLASLSGGMERLLHEPELRARLGARGPARAADFTWHQTARRTLAVYQRVIAGRPVAGANR